MATTVEMVTVPAPVALGDRRLVPRDTHATRAQQTIDNPLLTFDDANTRLIEGRTCTELEDYVYQFCRRKGVDLEDRLGLLIFGARLARDGHNALSRYDGELTESEMKLLKDEKNGTGFWKQSKFFKATILTASLGGMIQGWTQSVNNGTAYGMPDDFHLCIKEAPGCGSNADMWTFGMLNAVPWFSAGVFGTILADPLQENVLGRRGSIMLSCAITVASTIGASVTHNVSQLAVCRALNGIALGAKASIIPIYSGELSPQHIRGAILANWQLADAAGIFLGFLANLLVVVYLHDSSKCWRVLTNTALIPTVPLLIMIYLMPESPRYLMKHGRYKKALEAFTQIQTTPLLASRDFMYAHAQLDFESRMLGGETYERANLAERVDRSQHSLGGDEDNPYAYHIGVTGYFKRVVELWGNKRCRRALVSACIAMTAQQFSGVNTIAFLGTILLEKSLNSQQMVGDPGGAQQPALQIERKDARTLAIIGLAFGAANYLAGLPAYWLSDKVGRSIMLVLGLPNMAWSMLVFAFLFKIPEPSVRVPMVSIFAIVFVIFYGPTAGTSPFSIAAEVFPLVSREAGMAVAVGVNLTGAGILVLVFPRLINSIGTTGALSIFAGLNLVALVLVYLFVPETKGRTLEELQFTFDVSTMVHVRYRIDYILRDHLLGKRNEETRNIWKYLAGGKVKSPLPFWRWARVQKRRADSIANDD